MKARSITTIIIIFTILDRFWFRREVGVPIDHFNLLRVKGLPVVELIASFDEEIRIDTGLEAVKKPVPAWTDPGGFPIKNNRLTGMLDEQKVKFGQ